MKFISKTSYNPQKKKNGKRYKEAFLKRGNTMSLNIRRKGLVIKGCN